MKLIILISILSLFNNNFCDNQENIVLEFYSWYISVAGHQSEVEYRPVFKSDTNGMVILDMEKYIQNLRKYNFSENMIYREISTYKDCITKIKNVKYEELLEDFFYDEFGCSFVYNYRWIHSQETIDGVLIVEVKKISEDKQFIKGQFYNKDEENNEFYYWEWYCHITLIKEKNSWLIDDIFITDK